MLIKMFDHFCSGVDILNEWVGRIVCWFLLPLTFLVTLEVILRYIFNRPTIWIWDVNVQLLGVLIIFGGGYAFVHNAHIGVDVIVARLSPRKKAIIDLITYTLFLFSVALILREIGAAAWISVQTSERYNSVLMPPIYPFKVLVVLGIFFFYLQGIAMFLRSVMAVIFELTGVGK